MGVVARRVVAGLGLALHLAVGVLPYGASGLVAPPAGVIALWLLWGGLAVTAVLLARRRPLWVPAVPVVAVAAWAAVVTLGEALLGWTA